MPLTLDKLRRYNVGVVFILATLCGNARAQTQLSYTLDALVLAALQAQPELLYLPDLLDRAAAQHPSVQAARFEMSAFEQDLEAAQRQRWPAFSAVIENKSQHPSVTATRAMRLEHTLWDAGRTAARVREAEVNLQASEARVSMQNQALVLQIIQAWQNLLSADGRIQVARDTLAQLGGYREQMERRVKAEVSPPIDFELVQSRILQTEVEWTQALTTRQVALGRLEQYSGIAGLGQSRLRPAPAPNWHQTAQVAEQFAMQDWGEIASQHPDVQKARQDVLAAQQRIEAKRAEQWPQLYVRLDKPLGNSNSSSSSANGGNDRVAGFVGLRYTPGAGWATSREELALSSRAASLEQTVEVAQRQVLEALQTDRDEFASNRARLQALEKSVLGSRNVLASYSRQFTAGRKTWQDLMNAVRELAQNQYNLVDTQAALAAALYRLQVRSGQGLQPKSSSTN